ncbi:MAG: hypothetical protein HKL82_05790 [Acidimicrobiaceae bacterium]|nr:hypothetical protein [Acidimicrobiaceae bacterium]
MARVFSLPDFFLPESPGRPIVYKKIKAKYRPVPQYGLQSLVRLLSGIESNLKPSFERQLNWPVRVVLDDHDGAAGVILPLIPDEYFVSLRRSSGEIKRRPAEVQYLFTDSRYCARVGIPYPDESQRLDLCRSLSFAMVMLHKLDVVYGDLSARNILFRVLPKPAVLLVDCDAVRPKGGAAPLGAQPHSPDWEPPEAVKARARRDSTGYNIQNKETDRYKLGLAVLRILSPGRGCSTNTDPKVVKSVLPPRIYSLLEQSLSVNPSGRPEAQTWYKEFTS